jgi:hypothetical protein
VTTSGITSWPLTAGEIVAQATYELGAYSAGETPSGEDMEDGLLRLNGMLNYWSGEGNLYREETGTLVIAAATASGTLPEGVKQVSSVRHVVSTTNHRQLVSWERAQFYMLPNRIAVGSPSIYYVGKTLSGLTINLWPVSSTSITLAIDYGRAVETVTDPAETLDVPQDWQEAIIQGLASRMANMFGATKTDPSTVSRIDSRAAALYQRLLDRDRPDAYHFEPDY